MTGTGALVRLALRRDRIVLSVWIALLGVLPALMARSYLSFYPTAAERAGLTASVSRAPGIAVLYGQPYDLSTPGGFTAWRFGGFLALLIGLMAVFTVTRHTRAEEDTGRADLLASTAIGRHAVLAAGVVTATGACVAVGVVEAVVLMVGGQPVGGSWALGLATSGAGLVFTAVSAVVCQLVEEPRTANGLGSTVVGVAFLVRAVGDSTTGQRWVSWLSPIGWAQLVRPFAGERWWVVALPFATALVVVAVAAAAGAHRDLGAGVLPPRPGPPRAAPGLRSAFALSRRLQRGALIGWLVGLVVAGGVFGSIASGIGQLLGTSQQTRQVFERLGGSSALVDAFLAALAGIYGMIVTLYGVQALVRLRSEETDRAEPLLATSIGRLAWAGGHLAFVFGGSALAVVAGGAATGFTNGLRTGHLGRSELDLLRGSLVQVPATWLVLALSLAIFGLVPRRTGVAWGIAGAAIAISLFGPLVKAPQAVLDLSPFGHVPKLPGGTFHLMPLVVLLGLAVVAAAGGLVGLARRDLG